MSDMSEVKLTLIDIFQKILTELKNLKSTQNLIISEIKILKTAVKQVQHDFGVQKIKLDMMIDNGIYETELPRDLQELVLK